MNLNNRNASIFIPDDTILDKAINRTTHMTIAAHQDDIEIMAYHGISECFQNDSKWFFGVVVTDGKGSARTGKYARYTNEQMMEVRRHEQTKAAVIGEYGALAQLNYPSSQTKDKNDHDIIDDLRVLLLQAQPEVLYTHNLADKHDTHIGVVTKVIKALRLIPKDLRPKKVYGCEVWRSLDWINDIEKIVFDVDKHPNLASALVEVFDSQVIGGKRYDLAALGRRIANATYLESHQVDASNALSYAMDLTPLIVDDTLDVQSYVLGFIQRFQDDVKDKINQMM